MSDNIGTLLHRYFESDLTDEERMIVNQWIASSEENEKVARQVQLLYLASDTANVLNHIDVDKALSQVNHRIKWNNVKGLFRYLERAAAILLIPILAIMFNSYFSKDDIIEDKVTVSCNPGTITTVALPDGTVAHLNSNSKLTYPSKFTGEFREVDLEGEAFFEVTKNDRQHFIVNLNEQNFIEVRGTKFNVDAYEDVITTLVEGQVRFFFSNNGKKQAADLRPGQKLRYGVNDHQLSLIQTNCEREICWKDGWVIFENTLFEDVLKLLSTKFSVDFIVRNPEIKKLKFTGSFKYHRLEQILDCFLFSSDIKWRYVGDMNNMTTKSKIEIF